MRLMILCAALVAASFAWSDARAEDMALVLANRSYQANDRYEGPPAAVAAATALDRSGFVVIQGADRTANQMRALGSDLLAVQNRADALVIVLTGQFARGSGETWLLGVDAQEPNLATVDGVGLSVDTVLALAALRPGGAVVLLGQEPGRLRLGAGLQPGIGVLQVPQGVTVVRGPATAIANFAERQLVRRGVSLAALLQRQDDLTAEGFVSNTVVFRGPADTSAPQPQPPREDPAQEAFWRAVREQDTEAGYRTYLDRYPNGPHADEARAGLDRVLAEPFRAERLAEEALNLNRDARREIQRGLSILGFNPRGIDGLFGPGTRAAITAWQRQNGYLASGYLSRDQLGSLQQQATRRAAELEREAAAKQAEIDRQDRALWERIGGERGGEEGLRAYLGEFPDGLFSAQAQQALKRIEDARENQAQARDRAAWDQARAANTVQAYGQYLERFPRGAFAAQARRRIADLQGGEAGNREAQAAEAALQLNVATMRLVEQRLAAGGLNPGRVDGVFDDQTRRAIRRYQTARGLTPTGYLNDATVVRLLADAVIGR